MTIAKLADSFRSGVQFVTSRYGGMKGADVAAAVALLACVVIYFLLAWKASAAETRWQLDVIDGITVFYGDDAYRYFLARSAWIDPDIALQGFVLPAALFLDGVLATLVDNSLLLMRSAHAVISLFSIWLLYLAGRQLKVPAAIMLPSSLILALMPFYGYVSLSFYGEFWLAAAVSIALWAMLSRRIGLFVCLISVMPLLRQEGIYFLIMGTVFLAIERKRWPFLMAYIPGGVYFLVLLFSENGLQGSFYWRAELRQFLNMIEFSNNPLAMLNTYNNIWLFGGAVGLLLKPARPVWPFSVAACLWLSVVFFVVYFKLGDYEPRYTVPALPLIALGWGVLLAWLGTKLKGVISERILTPALIGLCAFVLLENLLQLHAVNQVVAYYRSHSELPDFRDASVQDVLFLPRKPEEVEDAVFMADFAAHLVQENPRINALVVSDVFLFYFLDAESLGADVNVAFSATYWPFSKRLLGDELMAVFPGGRHYGYFSLKPPAADSTDLLLYADFIGTPEHDVGWVRGRHQLHVFEYKLSAEPQRDFRDKPVINPLSIPPQEMAPYL